MLDRLGVDGEVVVDPFADAVGSLVDAALELVNQVCHAGINGNGLEVARELLATVVIVVHVWNPARLEVLWVRRSPSLLKADCDDLARRFCPQRCGNASETTYQDPTTGARTILVCNDSLSTVDYDRSI
jgi:hypothetical protein